MGNKKRVLFIVGVSLPVFVLFQNCDNSYKLNTSGASQNATATGQGTGGGDGSGTVETNPPVGGTVPTNPPTPGPSPTPSPTPVACTPNPNDTPIITTLPAGVTASTIAAVCPSIGDDTECGVVIIISDSGESLYFTGQGPYDGHDDTLVGVINLSNKPVSSLALSSTNDIMGFDGDGIDTYDITGTGSKVPGNATDKTTYGGPNAYFTNVAQTNDSGTINFITPVADNGGTAYFSLENALSATSACLTASTP